MLVLGALGALWAPARLAALRGRGVGHRPLRTRHLSWAALLWRVFEVDAWRCKRCGGPMKLRGIVDGPVGPHAVRQWLRARPPPVRVAEA